MAAKTPYDTPHAVELKRQLDELGASTTLQAELLVAEKLPEKIFELTRLLDNPTGLFCVTELPPTVAAEGLPTGKKRRAPDGSDADIVSDAAMPCNAVIMEQHTALKAQVDELIAMVNKIKLWVQLSIPRVEDGNNFGVAIQEDTIHELARTEDYGFSLMEQFTKYHATRTKLVSKLIKYPNLQDAILSVRALDEKEMRNTRLSLVEIRNSYLVLYDMVFKNFERIKQPRTANHTASMF